MRTRWVPWLGLLLVIGCDDGRVGSGDDGGTSRSDGRVGEVPTDCVAPPAPACGISLGAAMPASASASTSGGTDQFGDASCAMGGGAGAPDVAFQWTAPRAGRYDISSEGSAFDTVLTVRRGGCEGVEIACNDDVGSVRQARVTVELAACETVLIVVDGFSARETGAVQISIGGRETVCDDGIDDDGDGLVDCDDTEDCRTRECIEDGTWPPEWAELEWRVLELTNQSRARGATCGGESFAPAGPLEMNEVVRLAARLHSQDMGAQNYFEHVSLDGRTFSDRMSMAGFRGASPWGENIAAGQTTAERVVEGWMNSPGHCRNIMNPAYRVIGIGYAHTGASQFGHYWTQNFAAGH